VVFQLETSDAGTDSVCKATLIHARYTFHDIDSGESLSGTFVSSGPARDDKGLWAATTNAIKYILTSTFLIPTGDDAESDTNHPAPAKAASPAKEKPASKPATTKELTPKMALHEAFVARAADLNIVAEEAEFLREVCMKQAGAAGAKAHKVTQDDMIVGIGNKTNPLPSDAPEWSAIHNALALLTDEDMVKIDGALAVSQKGENS